MRRCLGWILIVVISGALLVGCFAVSAHADQTFSWLDGSWAQEVGGVPAPPIGTAGDCTFDSIEVVGVRDRQWTCVYQGSGFRYGVINWGGPRFVIELPGNNKMLMVDGMETKGFTPTPLSKDLIVSTTNYNGYSRHGYVIKDFLKQLTYIFDPIAGPRLVFNQNSREPIVTNEFGNEIETWAVGASPNGRYVGIEVIGKGFARIDMTTRAIQWYSAKIYDHTSFRREAQFSITNDGHYIAMAGEWSEIAITEITDGCGWKDAYMADNWQPSMLQNPCPKRDLTQSITRAVGEFQWATVPRLDYEGGSVLLYISPLSRPNEPYVPRWVRVMASGYQAHRLDYLAMGDSYSSGEGDTEYKLSVGFVGNYVSGTNQLGERTPPREMCHLSPRSYPFLLRDMFNIPTYSMRSVACSGAKTTDMVGDNESYLGQEAGYEDNRQRAPRLAGLWNAQDMKMEALNNTFTPGRNIQTEFVKKYQPRIVTITAGGNDLGFGDILKSCATKLGEWCEEARGSEKTYELGKRIQLQFSNLKERYAYILNSSIDTKLFVFGYPSFINDSPMVPCGLDGGYLNHDEKVMLNQSVHYFNQVIAAAAKSAGALYVDIEHSLDGGRICDPGGGYVTGIQDIFANSFHNDLSKIDSMIQTVFHPNHTGHQQIAASIRRSTDNKFFDFPPEWPDDSITAPPLTPYFANAANGTQIENEQRSELTSPVVVRSDITPLETPSYTFAPGTSIHRELHSDPVGLGDDVVKSDGSVEGKIVIPKNVPVGYHTLYLKGVSYIGTPLTLRQTVFVASENQNDRDDDGIPDKNDSCMFIDPIGIDMDHDGIDDMCDPIIKQQSTLTSFVGSNEVLQASATFQNESTPTVSWDEDMIGALDSQLVTLDQNANKAKGTSAAFPVEAHASFSKVEVLMRRIIIFTIAGIIATILLLKLNIFYKLFKQKYIIGNNYDTEDYAIEPEE